MIKGHVPLSVHLAYQTKRRGAKFLNGVLTHGNEVKLIALQLTYIATY